MLYVYANDLFAVCENAVSLNLNVCCINKQANIQLHRYHNFIPFALNVDVVVEKNNCFPCFIRHYQLLLFWFILSEQKFHST